MNSQKPSLLFVCLLALCPRRSRETLQQQQQQLTEYATLSSFTIDSECTGILKRCFPVVQCRCTVSQHKSQEISSSKGSDNDTMEANKEEENTHTHTQHDWRRIRTATALRSRRTTAAGAQRGPRTPDPTAHLRASIGRSAGRRLIMRERRSDV